MRTSKISKIAGFGFIAAAALLALAAFAPTGSAALGGPDIGGYYTWADGVHATPYVWNDIEGLPGTTQLALGPDEESPPIDIDAIDFEFYKVDRPTVYVSNNGWIDFIPGGDQEADPNYGFDGLQAMRHPDGADPNGMISGCWRDLFRDDGGENAGNLFYRVDTTSNQFIVQWTDYEHEEDFETVTFQIVLNGDTDTIDVFVQDCVTDTATPVLGPPTPSPYSLGIELDGTSGLNNYFSPNQLATHHVTFKPKTIPVAVNETNITMQEGDPPLLIDVLANDYDLDGDSFQIKLGSLEQNLTCLGTAEIVLDKIRYTINGTDRNSWTPGCIGHDTINYTIIDQYGWESTASFNLTVARVNDLARCVYGPTEFIVQELPAGELVPIWVPRYLDQLAAGAENSTDETLDQLTIEWIEIQAPTGPIFESPPTLLENGTLTWTYARQASGTAQYQLRILDNGGTPEDPSDDLVSTPVSPTFTVTSINDPPTWKITENLAKRNPSIWEDPHVVNPFDVQAQSFGPWVIERNPGPGAADEAEQGFYYTYEVSNPELFTANGQPRLSAKLNLQFTPAENKYGSSDVWITQWDDNGTPGDLSDDASVGPEKATIYIAPSNDPPTIVDDYFVYMVTDPARWATIPVFANDETAPDVDEALQFGTLNGGEVFHCSGSDPAPRNITEPAFGEICALDTGIGYRYNGTDSGLVHMTYLADDWGAIQLGPDKQEGTGNVTVQVIHPHTAATPDFYVTLEDQPIITTLLDGVLANDPKPAGFKRTVQLVSATSNGAVKLYENGTFIYEPNTNFDGADAFRYRIRFDDDYFSNVATVHILVGGENDAPIAISDDYTFLPDVTSIVVEEDGVMANDQELDNEQIIAMKSSDPRFGVLEFDNDGSFKYTPNPGFTGDDSFTYFLRDPSGPGNHADVRITVAANQGPTAGFEVDLTSGPAGQAPPLGEAHVFKFKDTSSDPDGEIVAWYWNFGNGDTRRDQNPVYVFGQPGEYNVTLTVVDIHGARDTFHQEILATDGWGAADGGKGGLPKADAGRDRVVLGGTRIPLDGSGGDGRNAIGFTWKQLSGAPVYLLNPNARQTSFEAPVVGPGEVEHLVFELVIFDGNSRSLPDTVLISVRDTLTDPVAYAGNDHNVVEGTVVTLRGKSVGFPETAQVEYLWQQTGGPAVGIGEPGDVVSFRAPPVKQTTELRFTLQASADGVNATQDSVRVTVRPVSTEPGIVYQPGIGRHSQVVAFDVNVLDLMPQTVLWTFGDGSNSSLMRPTHMYAEPGQYVVTVDIVTITNQTHSFQKAIIVEQAEVFEGAPRTDQESPGPWLGLLVAGTLVAALRRRK